MVTIHFAGAPGDHARMAQKGGAVVKWCGMAVFCISKAVAMASCHFLPPKCPVENRDFVDFCAKIFTLFFENGRYKVYL